ncbi:portal protein [Magnetovibrio sp. PR-2]|uniref:portal protein n=1 Tax=Magnetovibrio sp. PR-2 TaxID=3120356 RepID=UPI002FCE27B6
MDNDLLKQRWSEAKTRRDEWFSEIDESFLYTYPELSVYREEGQLPVEDVLFDSTPADAVSTLVSNVLNYGIPISSQWAKVQPGEIMRSQGVPGDVEIMLDHLNRSLFDELNRSNFYVAAGDAIRNAVVCGTGAMSVRLERDNTLRFTSIPIKNLYVLESPSGVLDTFFIQKRVRVHTLVDQYENLPKWLNDLARDKPDQRVSVLEVSLPTPDGYDHQFLLEKDMHVLEQHTREFPYILGFRWERIDGEAWGTSPVRHALNDIRVLNKMVENQLKASDFAAFGAWYGDDELIAENGITPGSYNVTQGTIHPISFPGNFAITEKTIGSYQNRIRRQLLDVQLPPVDTNRDRITSTEIQVRQGEFLRRIGPAALRLEREFFRPAVKLALDLLIGVGVLPDVRVDGKAFHIDVQSVIRKGHVLEQVDNSLRTLSMLAPFGQIAFQGIDLQGWINWVLKETDFPAEFIQPAQDDNPDQITTIMNMLMQQQGVSGGPAQPPPVEP